VIWFSSYWEILFGCTGLRHFVEGVVGVVMEEFLAIAGEEGGGFFCRP